VYFGPIRTTYFGNKRPATFAATSRTDGSYNNLGKKLQKTDVLLLDEWRLSLLRVEEARDLLDILEDYNQTRST
jgi:hypothetical protein